MLTWCDAIDLYVKTIPITLNSSDLEKFAPLNDNRCRRNAIVIAGSALNDDFKEKTLEIVFKVIEI